MGRTAAVIWHASLSVIAAGLYFFFVLPRWFELTDFIPHVLGTVLRLVTAAVIALAALPVAFTLLRTRKPEFGTPRLALQLLIGSIIAHIAAGVLILGTAVSEIWLSLNRFGPWLFGIYGAAAAVALLGIGAFYLSSVAELPPPPPKAIKPKKEKEPKQRRRSRKKIAVDNDGAESGDTDSAEGAEGADDTDGAEEDSAGSEAGSDDEAEASPSAALPDGAGDELPGAAAAVEAQADATPTETDHTEVEQTEATETLEQDGGRHKLPRGNRHKLPTGKPRLRRQR